MGELKAEIGVIGGSGIYDIDGMEIEARTRPETPWGEPSDDIVIGSYAGRRIAFLPRHGRGHFLSPSEVPSMANICALKMLGVKEIIAFSAVGSLREEIPPRDFVLPSQIIDRTRGIRPSTFFGSGVVAHAAFGDPFSSAMADTIYSCAGALETARLHRDKTLVCMEGPLFSTRSESQMYRSIGGDVINMSALPEAKLAREAEIEYQMICMSTDYDSWRLEEHPVTAEEIMAHFGANTDNAKRLLAAIIPALPQRKNPLQGSMRGAIITAPEKRNPDTVNKLNHLLPGYF